MITNRFLLLVAATMVLISTTTFAQDTKLGREGRGQRRGGGMNSKSLEKALDLTPQQTEKLNPAFKKLTDIRKKLSEDTTISPKAKREQIMVAMKDLMKSVEDVLTPEQKTKFDELKKKMGETVKNRKKKNN
jgi:Spy/CpxP family protein refolding chaperone